MNPDMVVSYVRDLLERLTGTRPEPDKDGDLPVTYEGASFYVRVVNPTDAIVQVFSVGIADIDPTPELMSALNDINRQIGFARAFHVAGQVLIEAEIWGSDINPANFRHACGNIAGATDAFMPELAKQLGGSLRFETTKTSHYDNEYESRSGQAGPYL